MSTPPLITVGIPFHNEEAYLRAAVISVLRQTIRDFELLLIDDCSDDDSLEIARTFLSDPRVRVLSDGRRKRLPARLNEIVRVARGSFVARMDADDLIHPERFERQLRVLHHEPVVDAVGTWAALIDENQRLFAVVESHPTAATEASALSAGVLTNASMFARREWLARYPYDETLSRAEDRDLWCRALHRSRLSVVSEPLYVVRVVPQADDFLADYREGQRQNRLMFRRYGPTTWGLARTMRAYAASFAKSAVMMTAARVGFASLVIRRRGRPPTAAEEGLVREALEAVDLAWPHR